MRLSVILCTKVCSKFCTALEVQIGTVFLLFYCFCVASTVLMLLCFVNIVNCSSSTSGGIAISHHEAGKINPVRKNAISAVVATTDNPITITRFSTSGSTSTSASRYYNIFKKAGNVAFKSGFSGIIAGVVQVITLMWLRTIVNYQYKYGVSMNVTIKTLYKQGGIARFYDGIVFAIIQGPLSRFGSIAANDSAVYLINSLHILNKNNLWLSTALGSVFAALWRYLLMPLDTCKTILQVDGQKGFNLLWKKVSQRGGISLLYRGSVATCLATVTSHYPWFYVYNILDKFLVVPPTTLMRHVRYAFIGFSASAVSDTISNCLRVIKTSKQAYTGDYISYYELITQIIGESGLQGLFYRGLLTRILTNGIQSMVFTVVWKALANKEKN